MSVLESQPESTTVPSPTRPLYWSIRRELWENRSIYLAPIAVASVVMVGFWISAIGLPHRRRAVMLLDEAHQRAAIQMPYDVAAMMIMFTAFIVGAFYCLDALYGERRDRTILFWKSLPVSDRTTVASKIAIPVVVLPIFTFTIILTTQVMILLVSDFILLASGLSPATLIAHLRFFPSPLIMAYGFAVAALWHAPLYSWLLLVSSWAKRATFLWAVLPFMAGMFLEKIVFNTTHFARFIRDRILGGYEAAFIFPGKAQRPPSWQFPILTPGRFLTSWGLWLGLLAAVALLAAAVRMRRYRDPI